LSQFNSEIQQSCEYTTGFSYSVTGAQTNEAPTKYAIKRLLHKKTHLDRIFALVTPKARETALDYYIKSVDSFCEELGIPKIEIITVDIPNDVTVMEILQKTIDEVFSFLKGDSVIIETTGGYRNAITALILFSRILRLSDMQIDFATFSDIQTQTVTDTRDVDQLFNMLDAVNAFACTGNTQKISKLISNKELPGKSDFFAATREFYYTFLVCKSPNIESSIKQLRIALDEIKSTEYDADSPKLLAFKYLVVSIVEQKMTFIGAEQPVLEFIKWCCDNWYLQQAVTFLKENIIKQNGKRYINITDYKILFKYPCRCLN